MPGYQPTTSVQMTHIAADLFIYDVLSTYRHISTTEVIDIAHDKNEHTGRLSLLPSMGR